MTPILTAESGCDSATPILQCGEGLKRILPRTVYEEILRLSLGRVGTCGQTEEIHLRAGAPSSVVMGGKNFTLFQRIDRAELCRVLDRAVAYSPFAYERELSSGCITLEDGIRVGIIYNLCHGAKTLFALAIRIPAAECSYTDELYELWSARGRGGTLLFSAPGGGKTTALAALCRKISREELLRIVIVDERAEIRIDGFADTPVDLIRGVPKSEAISSALRTLSPEMIATDEITDAAEARALLDVGRGGIPMIATVHASSKDELCSRACIRELIERGFFSLFVHLYSDGGHRGFLEVDV
jgi:stage III sporulation protein AA